MYLLTWFFGALLFFTGGMLIFIDLLTYDSTYSCCVGGICCTNDHQWVCPILHKYVREGNILIKLCTSSSGLPSSRHWRVLYFVNVIKISISFPVFVLVSRNSRTD